VHVNAIKEAKTTLELTFKPKITEYIPSKPLQSSFKSVEAKKDTYATLMSPKGSKQQMMFSKLLDENR
jgi:hypothetical protein